MDDHVFEDALRAWAAPSDSIDSDMLKVALHLDGLATSEESAAAQEILARDLELAEAFAIAAKSRPARRLTFMHGIVPLALAALIACIHFLRPSRDEPDLVPKGAVDHLSIAVERRGVRFELPSGRPLKEGDRFGLFYSAHEEGYLAIVHYSPSGADLFYRGPIASAARAALPKGGEVADVRGCEVLLAVFSRSSLDDEQLLKDLSFTDDCRLSAPITEARTLQVIPIER